MSAIEFIGQEPDGRWAFRAPRGCGDAWLQVISMSGYAVGTYANDNDVIIATVTPGLSITPQGLAQIWTRLFERSQERPWFDDRPPSQNRVA